MSAILSNDDLNDFIAPSVACIKPIETLPQQQPDENPYEVTTEDKLAASNPPPAQISLTDCLACSGCVTSAEAVLVSLQSHTEVLSTLDRYRVLSLPWARTDSYTNGANGVLPPDGKIFVASVSPQTRASLAATYGISEREAGNMIQQLLSGPQGLASGGAHGSHFTWVIDTNVVRAAALVAAADEVADAVAGEGVTNGELQAQEAGSLRSKPRRPILTSACPGWICYAEKTHPHVLPHLSRLKSPQALAGTLVKSVLARRFGIPPDRVWHLAVMPCFDKKLEASRAELTDLHWQSDEALVSGDAVRDVDCVITARELLTLADARGISFPKLPKAPLETAVRVPFPDLTLDAFLFPSALERRRKVNANGTALSGSSGGYLWHVLQTYKTKNPGSEIRAERGRNSDVVEYNLVRGDEVLLRAARYYGFRNIQNLVRRLKPAKKSRLPGGRTGGARRPGAPSGTATTQPGYAYVEVMACPGGCTNGGGQIKFSDLSGLQASSSEANGDGLQMEQGPMEKRVPVNAGPAEQKAWLARVDEAYYSDDSRSDSDSEDRMDIDVDGVNGYSQQSAEDVDGISHAYIHEVFEHWAEVTGVELRKLLYTSYRKVESDVGKKTNDVERVAGLASSIGGGW